jgi:hypothetical protein
MPDATRGRTEVLPEVVFLGNLVERVAAGKIRVPRFQRAFVWRQTDLHDLLDSVLRGFPIGSILVWETERAIESSPRIGPVEVSPPPFGPVGYLLDGQQRVSTLVGTLRFPDGMGSIVDQVDWRIYCDLDNQEFLTIPADKVEPRHFPVRSLLDTAGFISACRRIELGVSDASVAQRRLNEADRLASAFRDYQLPLIRIREADLDSAVTVFARLNRKGRRMAADEMVSALTYREGQFHLAKELDEFKHELDGDGFGNLDRVLLLRSVLAALDRDIYAKDWADLMVKQEVRDRLPAVFESAASGIRRALAFLKELGVTSDRLLPYGLQLVLLGEFFRLCRQPAVEVLDLLSRWFWVTSFTGWFGGVNTAQATQALAEVRELASGKRTEFNVVDLGAAAQPFPERFDGRSARVRAFLLYLTSLRPRSLGTPEHHLDPGRLLSARGTRALEYVSYTPELPRELFSSPANRMFLDPDKVGQTFVQLAGLSGDELRKLLPTHGFPEDSIHRLWKGDRAGLIEARKETLIAGEREFMVARNITLPAVRTAASIADSDVLDEE